jgi:hypothetical protein
LTASVAVKGRTESTRIFELLGPSAQVPDDLLRLRDLYPGALRAYRAQDWDAAEMGFRACLACCPGDGPSAVLLKRTESLRGHVPTDWSGTSYLEEK